MSSDNSNHHHHHKPISCGCDENDNDNIVIDIAVITEELPTITRNTAKTQYLSPIDITYNEFHNLFYFNNGKFSPNTGISTTGNYKNIIKHEEKYIVHSSGKHKPYNLLEELVQHYQTHLEDPPDCWDPCSRIEFEKKIGTIKSLFDIGICNVTCSLTLDEFFDALEANGIEMNPHTHMPTLESQQKKIIALVTTKFISNNHATENDKGVPDLNITWPFRIDFRASVKSPHGHGCGDCGKYKNHTDHHDYQHQEQDHNNNCSSCSHSEHGHIDHEPRSLNDLLEQCAKEYHGSSATISDSQIVQQYYNTNGQYKNNNTTIINNCLCLKRLHIPNSSSGTGMVNSSHLLKDILSPWSCTDWCEGDRYRTSYNMAKWELKCYDHNDEDIDCNDTNTSEKIPNTSKGFAWHQICHEDKEHCTNVVINHHHHHHPSNHHHHHHHHPSNHHHHSKCNC